MPTVQQVAAQLNQEAVKSLIRNVRAMPEDKITWQPMDKGRTTLSQVQECAIISGFTIYTLTHLVLQPDFNEAYGKELAALDTLEKALERLEENTAKMVAVIEAFPDADLGKTVQFPWMDEPSTMSYVMFMTHWNTVYHIGQVCYVQTLYGDNEMH